MELQLAITIGGILFAGVSGYFGAQIFCRVAIARLEVKVDALVTRVLAIEAHEVPVLRSQLVDARQEIAKLRDTKHEVRGLRDTLGMLVSLLSKYLDLKALTNMSDKS